jgi:hypothetical protein
MGDVRLYVMAGTNRGKEISHCKTLSRNELLEICDDIHDPLAAAKIYLRVFTGNRRVIRWWSGLVCRGKNGSVGGKRLRGLLPRFSGVCYPQYRKGRREFAGYPAKTEPERRITAPGNR